MSLREQTESGVVWSGLTNLGNQILVISVQILLARLIEPAEFGIVATVSIIMAICNVLIDGGFGQALVQKDDVSSADISSVFYFNLFLSFALYTVLFLTTPTIAEFFDEPRLNQVLPVLSLSLVIIALAQTQLKMLNRNLQFSKLFLITIPGSVIGGAVGVSMAILGWGVWAIVGFQLANQTVRAAALWKVADQKFRPGLMFSPAALKKMLPYGAGIMGEGLVAATIANINGFAIAKLFGLSDLAFYNRANTMQSIPTMLITGTFGSVLFPVIASTRNSAERSLRIIRETTTSIGSIAFPLMLFLIAIAQPLVVTLLTEKWLPSVLFLRLLPLVGICYFLSGTCLTILRSLGFSGATFSIAIVKNVVTFAALAISYRFGLTALVVGQVFGSMINLALNLYVVDRKCGYRVSAHLADLAPSFFASVLSALVTWVVVRTAFGSQGLMVVVGTAVMGITYVAICRFWRIAGYLRVEEVVLRRLALLLRHGGAKA